MSYDPLGLAVVCIYVMIALGVAWECGREVLVRARSRRRKHVATAGDPVRGMVRERIIRR